MTPDKYTSRYRIDLDADPIFVPEGFEVVEHRKGGILRWAPYRPQIELYLTAAQRKGVVSGLAVAEELAEFEGTMVNANALDYLVGGYPDAPWIIPDSWQFVEPYKSKHILFWGTQYRYEGALCVRSLDWYADARMHAWKAGFCWTDHRLNSQYPAAMIRKPKVAASATE